jgi:hypothetical protein
MGKFFKFGAVAAVAITAALGIAALSVFKAAQSVPDFYRDAVTLDPQRQDVARDQFVAETTALASDLHRAGRWQHVFTVEQINAWLALELAESYPDLATSEWREPRISIHDNEATIACRYENDRISTVLSLSLDVRLHEPNVIAVRVRRARAGALPVPLTQVLDGITQVARELQLRLEWRKDHGDPVALVTFPQPRDSQSIAVRLERVELSDGKLLVAGAMSRGNREQLVETDGEAKPTGDEAQSAGQASDDQPLVGAASKETRQE